MLSEEHKRKMQEGWKAARGTGEGGEGEGEDVRQAEIEEAAMIVLTGMHSVIWRGRSDVLHHMDDEVSDRDWSAAIKWLMEMRKIEKQGQKRGSQYRKTA